ncbi:DNA/RNA helicase domain-containing protein [Streptomyces sp. NRRL S-237]|uniref:DNA/RNA helicase domain-containing protein n=1 Tax=Streptomyces sp. NRRL S-237 TaxID=1463895 RepID=UPI0004C49574|nr:DNA/RNA helicase domain-containing protein [Streptomyces sp. NRRL S-237]
MHVYEGTVQTLAAELADPSFIPASEARFIHLFGTAPAAQEVRSWRRSWPRLVDAVLAAGMGELHVLLEYLLPATGERVDALLLGQAPGGRLRTVVIELKQWTKAQTTAARPGMVKIGERIVQHPARQVGGYVTYLKDWVSQDTSPLDVRGVAVLHDAPSALVATLRSLAGQGPSSKFPILGREDLIPTPTPSALADRLGCADLRAMESGQLAAFLQARHRPSIGLLRRAGGVIEGNDALTLIGDQDLARQEILHTVTETRRQARKSIIVVTGGPGTGKTAIACRLLGDLCAQPHANPRLATPSGTLTRQLQRTVGPAARGLITTLVDKVPAGLQSDSVVLLDEAHRARTYPDHRRDPFPTVLGQIIDRVGVIVLFLDEQQIVRPSEGVTLQELRHYAHSQGHTFWHTNLTTQFRCNGSRAYLDWVNQLLQPAGPAPMWTGSDYDLASARNPHDFESWVTDHIAAGRSARITAGFCWPWESPSTPPLRPEVTISWTGPDGSYTWSRPWNARADETSMDIPDVPGRPYWATDAGGHQQVGCVYTAQGMEYDYNVVIMGNDIVRRGNRWIADPDASHDKPLKVLPAHRYLTYALNAYRVLASRGSKGTRLYSTDPVTQAYLQSLLPGGARNQASG